MLAAAIFMSPHPLCPLWNRWRRGRFRVGPLSRGMEQIMNGGKLVVRQSQSGKWWAVSGFLLTAIFGITLAAPAAGQESNDLIEELIVNATRLPRMIEDIAGTVSVIAAEDIERGLV